MADTSGFGHLPGLNIDGTLNQDKVDQRLLAMLFSTWPPNDTTFLLPAHVILHEKDGFVDPTTLRTIYKGAPNLEDWSGHGNSGESFALQGIISRGQLRFLSSLPGVKFIWLLSDRTRWTYGWPGLNL